LTEKQLISGVNDTRFLEPLAERLAGELNERGRTDWQKEVAGRWSIRPGASSARSAGCWRIKGSGRLTQRRWPTRVSYGIGATSKHAGQCTGLKVSAIRSSNALWAESHAQWCWHKAQIAAQYPRRSAAEA
jgi:hypothetical protein